MGSFFTELITSLIVEFNANDGFSHSAFCVLQFVNQSCWHQLFHMSCHILIGLGYFSAHYTQYCIMCCSQRYRGIFRTPVLQNILDKLVYNNEYETLNQNLTNCNIGSRKRRNKRENLFVINSSQQSTYEATDINGYDVLLSQSLWLKCALLCLHGSLKLDCTWTAPQCESPQVISLAKSKYLHNFGIFFWQTLNYHYSSTVRAFDLIPKLRATSEYQLSSGSKYTVWLASAFHPYRNLP